MAVPGPAAAMTGDQRTGIRESDLKDPGIQAERLDRALVTGLMLEVILETSSLQVDPQTRRHLVKTRLKGSLAANLAGQITLDRFRCLLGQGGYLVPSLLPPDHRRLTERPPAAAPVPAPAGPAGPSPAPRGLRLDRLRAWLQEEGRDLLPRRPHRKLNQERLWEFLGSTQGGWFRLLDFTRHFGVDRKTAWDYVQKFLRTGLLRHNRGRSAAVRYALGTRFLVVRADALEPGVRKALEGLPPDLGAQVSGWLIATGGEAFREQEWHGRLEPVRCRQVITSLTAAGLLEEAGRVGNSRMLQIAPRWRRD